MKSIAYVVGEGSYLSQHKLQEAVKDATDINDALKRLGYDTILSTDCNLLDFGKGIADFQTEAQKYEVALFYFSGHGVMENGENYLCPIDLDSGNIRRIINTSKKLEDLMSGMPDNLKVKIFIIDACRTDINDIKGFGKGICPTHAPKGSIVAFATSPGVEADAGGPNGNSMYTSCLLKYIETKGIAIEECFKRVRTELYKLSNEEQWSWEHTSLIGDYYFNNNPVAKSLKVNSYGQQALADFSFLPDTSEGGKVITLLKSHNWYQQKDGFDIFNKLRPDTVNCDYQFVIGRNILQAACGDSMPAVAFFDNLGFNLLKWQENDGTNHVLDGILYETYFNREGNLRAIGTLKSDFIDNILVLENDIRFKKSFEFIHDLLVPYSSVLYYVPNNKEPNVDVHIELEEEDNGWGKVYNVKNIKYQGTIIYECPENHSQTICRGKMDFFLLLRKYFGIPSYKITINTNMPFEDIDADLQIEYPIRLDIPKR